MTCWRLSHNRDKTEKDVMHGQLESEQTDP
jgi:hypothetical protein